MDQQQQPAGKAETPAWNDGPLFPSHPPYNWKMLRRRMELGRYVLDRQKLEEEERYMQLGPYYRTLGKKRPRRRYTLLGVKFKYEKRNPRVLHPKGVDWNLFRDDVLAMCDASTARDKDGDHESKNSVTSAANKIKEVSLRRFFPQAFLSASLGVLGVGASSVLIFALFDIW
jgi:hypothetical protein